MRAVQASGITAALLALLVVAGCGGVLTKAPPQKQRFKLTAQREGVPERACDCTLRVERVRVARNYERKRFVYQVGQDEFEEDFYNEFYAPPGELIRQATGAWLADSGLFASVIGATDGAVADWLLQGRVNKLYVDVREKEPRVVFEINYSLLDARKRQVEPSFKKRYGHTRRAASRSAEAIVAAWGESLTAVLAALETDLRAHFAERPAKR